MIKPKFPVHVELQIQKSRFLALIFPIETPEEAREQLKALKSQYEDASHVVHGFITGRPNSLTTGYSDDGEPPGTAGRPAFDVLKGKGATGIFLGVVRWFGGTKLGTGGLVKAYSESARQVLEMVEWEEDLDWVNFTLTLEYPLYEAFKRALETRGGKIRDEAFSDHIVVQGQILAHQREDWDQWVQDATKGSGQVVWKV